MKVLKSHLALYFIFGILYFLSTLMNWTYLSYAAKPLFIGAISFYYIEESKSPLNYYNCSILTLLFFSGVINLLEGYNYLLYVVFFNFLAYCLLLFQLIKKLIQERPSTIEKGNFLSVLIILLFLTCVLYISSFIVFDRSFEWFKVMLVYGFALCSFVLAATLTYLSAPNPKNTFLILYALDVIICELFYGIYHYYYQVALLRFTSILCYIISFYLLAHYFLKENNNSVAE